MPKCRNTNTRSASNSTATKTSKSKGGTGLPTRFDGSSRVFIAGSDNGNESGGLRSFGFDAATGAIRELHRIGGIKSPIYFALSRDKRFLYTAQRSLCRDTDSPSGSIAAYSLSPDGEFRFINEVPCAPSVPCHVSVSLCGAFVLYAEYSFGTAGVLRIRENDGGLDADTRFSVTHSGKLGPDKERQDRPHCHYIKQAPSGTVYVCDLGTDEVVAYELENAKLRKHANAAFNAAPGAGPRHMIFDAAGKRAYLLNELDNTLVAFDCSGDALRATQTLSTVPAGFSEFSKAAAVKISPSGNWVLASNRGHDSIAAFRVGSGASLSSTPVINKLAGLFPRDFEFSPDGNFAVVGHKLSDEIATYRFDDDSGVLTPTGFKFSMTKPLCFAFL